MYNNRFLCYSCSFCVIILQTFGVQVIAVWNILKWALIQGFDSCTFCPGFACRDHGVLPCISRMFVACTTAALLVNQLYIPEVKLS